MTVGHAARPPTEEENALKAELLRAWEADRAALIFERPFVSSLAMRLALVPVVDHRVPTACTDGESIWFNPFFLQSLTAPERVFVLAHEVWHSVMLHGIRRGDRAPHRWNLAIDHEVNNLLLHDGWKMPDCAVLYPQCEGMSAEEVYELIGDDAEEEPLDVHLEPGANGHGIVGGTREPRGDEDRVQDPDFTPWIRGMEVWAPWPGHVRITAAQMRARGTLSRVEDATLNRLAEGQIDWRRELIDVVTRTLGGTRTWSPPARRHVYRGLYLPSQRAARLVACVAVDTSGSTHALLPAMLGELRGLLSTFGRWELRLLWADSRVQREEVWTSDDPPDFEALRVPLGGGTDFRPVFARLEEDPPPVLIYVTDGHGPAPEREPPWPVLWVLTCLGAKPPAPWGRAAWFEASKEEKSW